jgi:hypothetical protein
VTDHHQWTGVSVAGLSSFGEDAAGNLYACSLNDGSISRLIWKTTAPARAKRR